jgi:dihydrofolate reductase
MGHTTFEPALPADRRPWPNLDVFVLGAEVSTEGAPALVMTDSDPVRLLEKLHAANRGGDVHLIGGPRTIETFRALGALDKLELVILPLSLGAGMRLTPSPARGRDTAWSVVSRQLLVGVIADLAIGLVGSLGCH